MTCNSFVRKKGMTSPIFQLVFWVVVVVWQVTTPRLRSGFTTPGQICSTLVPTVAPKLSIKFVVSKPSTSLSQHNNTYYCVQQPFKVAPETNRIGGIFLTTHCEQCKCIPFLKTPCPQCISSMNCSKRARSYLKAEK